MVRYSLVLFALMFSINALAGDTTWVQAHANINLPSSPKNIDTMIEFPDGTQSYRKILMIFTLGKYQCPGNPQYCGDWDYTVQNFLLTKGGDTVEIGRLITPYANASAARTPWSWKERYVFDVTDYYTLLKDSATVRTHYSGYSGGFTADIKFAFIEGTPPRNVLKVERLWHGSYRFGDTSGGGGIDTKILPMTVTPHSSAVTTELKVNITGHGADDNYCSEFCKKYYKVMFNNGLAEQKDIWRADCGFNHLYPQSGTWVYDRGNWCPGDLVYTNTHKLAGVQAATPYDIDLDFESYIGSTKQQGTSWGSYIIDAAVIDYSAFNKNLDASLDDIVAPNNHEMHYRYSPFTGNPIVRVTNTGGQNITSLKINYHTTGAVNTHTWNGNLAPLQTIDITMPEDYSVRLAAAGNGNMFYANIAEVNGTADDDKTNDSLTSTFTTAPLWNRDIVVRFKTNNSTINGRSESNWYLVKGDADTVARRTNNNSATIYEDTLHLDFDFYRLIVTDAGCDGLKFWANSGGGTGSISVTEVGQTFPYGLNGYFSGDFGCGFTHRFNTAWPASVLSSETVVPGMEIYPNPGSAIVTVNIRGMKQVKGEVVVTDALGRVVMQSACTSSATRLDASGLMNGVYTIRLRNEDNSGLQGRLVIAR